MKYYKIIGKNAYAGIIKKVEGKNPKKCLEKFLKDNGISFVSILVVTNKVANEFLGKNHSNEDYDNFIDFVVISEDGNLSGGGIYKIINVADSGDAD